MKQKYRSETVKLGEPDGHQMAVEKTRWFLDTRKRNREWEIDVNPSFSFGIEFRKQLPTNRTFMGHVGDIGIFEKRNGLWQLIALVEIGGDVAFWYPSPKTGKPKKESPTKHSKAIQKKNDKIIKNWCENNNVEYITLKKEEILGDCKADPEFWLTGLRYLEGELKDWIK